MTTKKSIYRALLPFLLLPVAATLPAGCAADAAGSAEQEGEPVVFALALNPSATRAEVANRTIDNTWPADKTVTISNGTASHTFTTGDAPSTVSTTATALTATGDNFIWPINNPHWEFEAWYPSGDAPATTLTVATNQSAVADDVFQGYDQLYCPSTPVTYRQRPVTLTMLHQAAHVVVIVNSYYTEDHGEVTAVDFGTNHTGLTGTVDTRGTTPNTNGETTWTVPTQTSTINMRPFAAQTDATNHTYAFECIIPPQAFAANINNFIKIYSHGTTKGDRTFNYKVNAAVNMLSGYEYTYNMLISEAGMLTLATVQVDDWTTGDPVSGTLTIPQNNYPASNIE